MDPTARLHVLLPRSKHDALLVASKRAGVSMAKLIDIGVTDLLAKLERTGAVVLPLRPGADQGGEFRIVPQPHKLEPPGTAAAVGTPGAAPAASSPSPPAAAAVSEVQS